MRVMPAYFGAALMAFSALFVLTFRHSEPVRAQSVVDTTITLGGSVTFTVDATKLALVPGCSRSAGCISTIKLCNVASGEAINPKSCVVLNGTNGAGNTILGYTIEETTPASASTPARISDYTVATVQVSIPPTEAEVVP